MLRNALMFTRHALIQANQHIAQDHMTKQQLHQQIQRQRGLIVLGRSALDNLQKHPHYISLNMSRRARLKSAAKAQQAETAEQPNAQVAKPDSL